MPILFMHVMIVTHQNSRSRVGLPDGRHKVGVIGIVTNDHRLFGKANPFAFGCRDDARQGLPDPDVMRYHSLLFHQKPSDSRTLMAARYQRSGTEGSGSA